MGNKKNRNKQNHQPSVPKTSAVTAQEKTSATPLWRRVWEWIFHADTGISWIQRVATLLGIGGLGTFLSAVIGWLTVPKAVAFIGIAFFVLVEIVLILVMSWARRSKWLTIAALSTAAPLVFLLGWWGHEILPSIGKLPNGSPIGNWHVVPPATLGFELDIGPLAQYEAKYQIGVLCRAYNSGVDFLDDPVKQRSNFFHLGGTHLKISMPIDAKLGERLFQTKLFQCAPVLAPLGPVTTGTKIIIFTQRVTGSIPLQK